MYIRPIMHPMPPPRMSARRKTMDRLLKDQATAAQRLQDYQQALNGGCICEWVEPCGEAIIVKKDCPFHRVLFA